MRLRMLVIETVHFVPCICLLAITLAQESLNATQKVIDDFIPLLSDNSRHTPKNWKTRIGGQNFTWCCTTAVANSLFVDENNKLAVKEDGPVINLNVTALQIASDENQFPCTAVYDGDYPDGSPEINVNYTWFAETCPGWELNSPENLNAWLQPLSGFLLPAVIFCLSVPRRRKIHVSRDFFVADLAGVKSYIPAFLGAVGAVIIVTFDTMLWLSICFALAGPMILSGLYEALLDSRVIELARDKILNRNLTLDMRCRLLMVVLIGNLDLAVDDDPLITADMRPRKSSRQRVIKGISPDSSPGPVQANNGGIESGETRAALIQDDSHDHGFTEPNTTKLGIQMQKVPSPNEHDVEFQDGQPRGRLDLPGVYYRDTTARETSIAGRASPGSTVQTRFRTPTPEIRLEHAEVGATAIQRRSTTHLKASPWRHMEELLYPIRLYDDGKLARHLSPRQYPKQFHEGSKLELCPNQNTCTNPEHIRRERPRYRTPEVESHIRRTKTRLRTMLNCQYSFGSMVGAPVSFFLGGFIFALLQSLQSLGSEDIALALAFGQFYMTVPHIAIVSGLLLAGNNPNILEGVFATQRDYIEESETFLGLSFGLAYPSCYKVAWQWHRGHNKKRWINLLIDTYSQRSEQDNMYWDGGPYDQDDTLMDLESLREKTTPSLLDWFLILSMTGLLLGVPFVLALLTAYFTPEVGISCRSFTFICYASAQLGQILLWLWAYAGPPGMVDQGVKSRGFRPFDVFRRRGWLDRHGFYQPRSVDHFLNPNGSQSLGSIWRALRTPEFRDIRSLWCCLWYCFYVLFCGMATLAAVGGTLMQIVGVYSADICYVTVDYWMDPFRPGATALISVNSKRMIQDAQIYWKPCAITAIVFMSFVSFVGWWYQRRMRDLFMELVNMIDHDRYDRQDARATKRQRAAGGTFSGEERDV